MRLGYHQDGFARGRRIGIAAGAATAEGRKGEVGCRSEAGRRSVVGGDAAKIGGEGVCGSELPLGEDPRSFWEIHHAQEGLVASVVFQPSQGPVAFQILQRDVLLPVGTFEPLECMVGVAEVAIDLRHIECLII